MAARLECTNLTFSISTTGAFVLNKVSVAWVPTISTWYFISVDFDGTTYRLYVNGAMIGSGGAPAAIFDSTARMAVGNNDNLVQGFLGHIDEVRITRGMARYASDSGFSPPTTAFPRS
jgi:Concanavalin A-like lectin/glucanases superfamily